MDNTAIREKDHLIDLEIGVTTSEEETGGGGRCNGRRAKKLLGRVWSGFVSLDGTVRDECGHLSTSSADGSADEAAMEMLIDEKSIDVETTIVGGFIKNIGRDKRKKMGKPPKPPRPPRGPSLDAADQKLVKEISELAMLKRARIERMRQQRKLKAGKAVSSSNSNLFAMIVTVLFCFVIVFQGVFGKNSSSSPVSFDGSPESAMSQRGLISIQYYKKNASDSTGIGNPSSGPQDRVLDQTSVSTTKEEDGSRVVG